MLATAFTELVGCRLPIQLAAMGGGVTTPELVVAVSRAGGLGMLQRGGTRPLAERIAEIEDAQAGPFGVNFVPALGQGEREEVELAASLARLVEFFWADPDPELVAHVHAGGALSGWQVGSVEEARRAAEAGCDLVIAQSRGGGHVRGTVGLLPCWPRCSRPSRYRSSRRAGSPLRAPWPPSSPPEPPPFASGHASWPAPESGAHPDYIEALLASGTEDTVLTTTFGIGWPDAPHRVLASAIAAAEAFDDETVGALEVNGESQPLHRFAARTPTREVTGTVEAMALYAGEGVGLVNEIEDAESLVHELAEGAEALLQRWALDRPG